MIKEKVPVEGLFKTAFQLLFSLAIAATAISLAFRHEIMLFLYNDLDPVSGNVFGMLIVSFIGMSISFIAGTLLTANGNMKLLNQLAVVGIVINVLLNWLLIPEYGAFGAALATFITQVSIALLQMHKAIRIFQFNLLMPFWGRQLLYIILVSVTTYGIVQINIDWLVQMMVLTGLIIAITFLTKQVVLKDILSVLKQR